MLEHFRTSRIITLRRVTGYVSLKLVDDKHNGYHTLTGSFRMFLERMM